MGVAILIRHGHSTANADGILSGRAPGVHLSERGQREARELAVAFANVPVDHVHVSPLERTQQTATLIFGDRVLHDEYGIIECDYGDWSGRPLADLAKEPLWTNVQNEPESVVFPNGESLTAMALRAVDTVHRLSADKGVHAFVSHGDIIKAVVSDASGAPFSKFQRIVIDPCSISVIMVGDEPRLLAANVPIAGAAAVLAGLVAAERGTVGGGGGAP